MLRTLVADVARQPIMMRDERLASIPSVVITNRESIDSTADSCKQMYKLTVYGSTL